MRHKRLISAQAMRGATAQGGQIQRPRPASFQRCSRSVQALAASQVVAAQPPIPPPPPPQTPAPPIPTALMPPSYFTHNQQHHLPRPHPHRSGLESAPIDTTRSLNLRLSSPHSIPISTFSTRPLASNSLRIPILPCSPHTTDPYEPSRLWLPQEPSRLLLLLLRQQLPLVSSPPPATTLIISSISPARSIQTLPSSATSTTRQTSSSAIRVPMRSCVRMQTVISKTRRLGFQPVSTPRIHLHHSKPLRQPLLVPSGGRLSSFAPTGQHRSQKLSSNRSYSGPHCARQAVSSSRPTCPQDPAQARRKASARHRLRNSRRLRRLPHRFRTTHRRQPGPASSFGQARLEPSLHRHHGLALACPTYRRL